MYTECMEGTFCSKSLTLTKWNKYLLDIIILALRLEIIWPVGFEPHPFNFNTTYFETEALLSCFLDYYSITLMKQIHV